MSLSNHVTDLPRGVEVAAARAAVDAVEVDERHIIDVLTRSVDARTLLVAELKAQVSTVEQELRRSKRALALLTGETEAPGGPRTSAGRPPSNGPAKPGKTGIGQEKLDDIEAAIRDLAEQQDEFRQVDVRQLINIKSSVAAMGFEALRQAGIIRLARREGNNKWFRLTPEGLRGQSSADAPDES